MPKRGEAIINSSGGLQRYVETFVRLGYRGKRSNRLIVGSFQIIWELMNEFYREEINFRIIWCATQLTYCQIINRQNNMTVLLSHVDYGIEISK